MNAKNDPSPGDLDEKSFQKIMGSDIRIYSWDYPEVVLVDEGINRAAIDPEKTAFYLLNSKSLVIFLS